MKKIVVQGLGYVGLAMLTFSSGAKKNSKYIYNVIGVEKNSSKGLKIIKKIKTTEIPTIVDDENFIRFYSKLCKGNRIKATVDDEEYAKADVIFVCSNCNFNFKNNKIELKNYINNINQISQKIKNNCLIIIQTTLPPGTTETVLKPLIEKNLKKRKIKKFYLCHSFERITPGKYYYSSMKNAQRVIGSTDNKAFNKAKKIFKDIFNLKSNKIVKLNSASESETCKIIENSYRATNIAFIDEWRKFCSKNNLDLEKILDVIRQRKTHNNIMRSGIGVGGYCLTKDPLFGNVSSQQILKSKIDFPISKNAVSINQKMTNDILNEIKNKFKKNIFRSKKVVLLGVSYKEDTNDTRYSSAEKVYNFFKKEGCEVSFYDPIVNYWEYIKKYSTKKKELKSYDIYIYLVKHNIFKRLNFKHKKKSLILDLNHVLEKRKKIYILKNKNYFSYFIGSKIS